MNEWLGIKSLKMIMPDRRMSIYSQLARDFDEEGKQSFKHTGKRIKRHPGLLPKNVIGWNWKSRPLEILVPCGSLNMMGI